MSRRYQPVEVNLTLEQLEELCAEWQERLRLQDWDISVCLKRAYDLPDGAAGHIHCYRDTKGAQISILEHVDWTPTCWDPQDMEQILVHELMHLHTDAFAAEKGTLAHDAMEVCIDCTARALVALKRDGAKPDAQS